MLKPKQALGAPLPFPWVHGWNPINPIPQLYKYTHTHTHTHKHTYTGLRVNPLSSAAVVTMEMSVKCLRPGLHRCMTAHLDLIIHSAVCLFQSKVSVSGALSGDQASI